MILSRCQLRSSSFCRRRTKKALPPKTAKKAVERQRRLFSGIRPEPKFPVFPAGVSRSISFVPRRKLRQSSKSRAADEIGDKPGVDHAVYRGKHHSDDRQEDKSQKLSNGEMVRNQDGLPLFRAFHASTSSSSPRVSTEASFEAARESILSISSASFSMRSRVCRPA